MDPRVEQNFFWQVLSRCPGCGETALELCRECEALLATRAESAGLVTIPTHRDFPMRALYRWEAAPSGTPVSKPAQVIQAAIIAMKERSALERGHRPLIERMAERLLLRARQLEHWPEIRTWSVLAPPGRSGRFEFNHAGRLAAAFAEGAGMHLERGLTGERHRAQKLLSRRARSEIRFKFCKAPAERPRFLFLDDVLATGATARAVWQALGRPAQFEAWALAYREPRLAGTASLG